jgi:hypothetical protein
MNLVTIALIAAVAWVSLFVVVLAICRVASRADAVGERIPRRRRTHTGDPMHAALR